MSGQNNNPKERYFRLSLTDEQAYKQKWSMRFTKPGFFVRVISAVVVLAALAYVLFAYTPLRTLIPGYPNAQTRRQSIQDAIRIDSLETVIARWEYYSENLMKVVSGETPLPVDSVLRLADAVQAQASDVAVLAGSDSLLRAYVAGEEQFGVSSGQERKLPLEGIHFFAPMKGVVSEAFDGVLHPYVGVSAPVGSVVMAVLDGSVIFDGWSDEDSYVIVIQHEDDLVSIYEHNEKLLKRTGDRVTAGSSIALAGGDGEAEGHLHFELWHKGLPVDPAKYINF